MTKNTFEAPFEVKLAGDGAATGEFEGYASVFNNLDSHGDIIMPGAFKTSLDERAGRPVPMHIMHGFLGGDGVPVGVWKTVAEDSKGLHVEGKISGVNTDSGKLLHERVKDGALGGLSVGYRVRPNGATYGKSADAFKRKLSDLKLVEISLVSDPSNPHARVSSVKATATADMGSALASLGKAMRLHDASFQSGYAYANPKDKAVMMNHLRDAHFALAGTCAPDGLDDWKASVSREEFEAKAVSTMGMTPEQARTAADVLYGDVPPGGDVDVKTALSELSFLSGFTLPKL